MNNQIHGALNRCPNGYQKRNRRNSVLAKRKWEWVRAIWADLKKAWHIAKSSFNRAMKLEFGSSRPNFWDGRTSGHLLPQLAGYNGRDGLLEVLHRKTLPKPHAPGCPPPTVHIAPGSLRWKLRDFQKIGPRPVGNHSSRIRWLYWFWNSNSGYICLVQRSPQVIE